MGIDWNVMEFSRDDHKRLAMRSKRPETFSEMVTFYCILSKVIPRVRIDFFEEDGKAMFSEMAIYNGASLVPWKPIEWDAKLGNLINLKGAYGS